jgi:hypothetical protein
MSTAEFQPEINCERRLDRARGFEKSSLEPVARTKWIDWEKTLITALARS